MFQNDDLDFYQEENHKEDFKKYKTPNGFATYEIYEKVIQVKDDDNVTIQVKKSRNGPIINNVLDQVTQVKPIAMSWIYTKFDNDVLEALFTISHAKEMSDVKKGASLIHSPGLNIMYGDAKGNIAWWAAGKLYKHKPHVNTKFVLNGASGEDNPIKYLDFSENPMAENPKWNYVYSANNQPDTISGILYPGYYLPEDRAKRIVELIAPKNDWTKEDYTSMLNDVTSAVSPSIIKEFISFIDFNSFSKKEKEAIKIIQSWDGSNTKDNVAPTIYNKWIYLYLKNTFEDEMGETVFNHLLNTHLMKRTIATHLKKDTSKWWDDITTANKKETKKDILSKSFIETVAALENQLGKDISHWTWGKVHTLEHQHPLGTVSSLRNYFNVGPFPMKGAREVIDNRGFEYNSSGKYKILSGPSTRRIVDFSDVENSLSILPTGQSGNPFSKFYKDQVNLYNEGKFRKMKMNKEEIINTSTKLIFTPKNE
jgi:penicillin amidase